MYRSINLINALVMVPFPGDKFQFLKNESIDHFTVACSVTWPLNACEAGGDLALIQTSLVLSCKCY